jgi:photosystem II stability/assembly factor-like uncharacterized protein
MAAKILPKHVLSVIRSGWIFKFILILLVAWVLLSLYLIIHKPIISPYKNLNWFDSNFREHRPLPSSRGAHLIFGSDSNHVWLGIDNGLLFSQDNGDTWEWRYQAVRNYVSAYFLLKEKAETDSGLMFPTFGEQDNSQEHIRQIWIALDDGSIVKSTDQGRNWKMHKTDNCKKKNQTYYGFNSTNYGFKSLYFADEKNGWAVGQGGLICHSEDGGKTWHKQNSGTESFLNSIYFVDNQHGWAAGDEGVILVTQDGNNWSQQKTDTKNSLNKVRFLDINIGWAIGEHGTLLHTNNSGINWERYPEEILPFEIKENLTALHHLKNENGLVRLWTAGDGRVIYYDGKKWENLHGLAESPPIGAIDFKDENNGWFILPVDMEILSTVDGAKTWAHYKPALFKISSNYWFATAGMISAIFLGLLIARQKIIIPAEPDADPISIMLSSDRPQRGKDKDALGSKNWAWAISRFLRHQKTEPPLTIAINAPWGGGKSSLMNWLKEDLERFGYRPIWFNAWHYEKQEQMFPALMERVRTQAIPPWYLPDGLLFRTQLLRRRIVDNWISASLIVVFTAFVLGYWGNNQKVMNQQMYTRMTCAWEKIFNKQPQSDRSVWLLASGCENNSVKKESITDSKDLNIFDNIWQILLGAPLIGLWKGLQAFRKPDDFLRKFFNTSEEGKSRRETAVKEQFARDFSDVTQSLAKTLIIFIDDLDRCQPRSVCEVLEIVNFLSLEGQCHVLFGMWRDGVERAVGLGFADTAMDMEYSLSTRDAAKQLTEAEKTEIRQRYGQRYLEKLINIWVDVPAMGLAEAEKMVLPDETQVKSKHQNSEFIPLFESELSQNAKSDLWLIPLWFTGWVNTQLDKLYLITSLVKSVLNDFTKYLSLRKILYGEQDIRVISSKAILLRFLKHLGILLKWLLARCFWIVVIAVPTIIFLYLLLQFWRDWLQDFAWDRISKYDFEKAILILLLIQCFFYSFSPKRWSSRDFGKVFPSWVPSWRGIICFWKWRFSTAFERIISALAWAIKTMVWQTLLFFFLYLGLLQYLGTMFISGLGLIAMLLFKQPALNVMSKLYLVSLKSVPSKPPKLANSLGIILLIIIGFSSQLAYNEGKKWPPERNINQKDIATKGEKNTETKQQISTANQTLPQKDNLKSQNESLQNLIDSSVDQNQKKSSGRFVVKTEPNNIVKFIGTCVAKEPIPPWNDHPLVQSPQINSNTVALLRVSRIKVTGVCVAKDTIPPWDDQPKERTLPQKSETLPPLGEKGAVIMPMGSSLSWMFFAMVVMLIMGIRFIKNIIELPKDSPTFTNALKFWLPVMAVRFDTPRRLKRFINDLRFDAMRLHTLNHADPTFFDRIWLKYILHQPYIANQLWIEGQESTLLLRSVVEACCGFDSSNLITNMEGKLMFIDDWENKLTIDPTVIALNNHDKAWAERLKTVLVERLKTFQAEEVKIIHEVLAH